MTKAYNQIMKNKQFKMKQENTKINTNYNSI